MTDEHARVVELVEKMALVRRDLKQKGDLEKYTARLARVEQKVEALAAAVEPTDPAAAKAMRAAWHTPARSLAVRNVEHQREQDS